MWDVRERKELRVTPRVWAQETGKTEVPFTDAGEDVGGYRLEGGKESDLGCVILRVSLRHPHWTSTL